MAQLNITLTDENLEEIRAAAEDAGIPISVYVRAKVLRDGLPRAAYEADLATREELEELAGRVESLEEFRTDALRRAA